MPQYYCSLVAVLAALPFCFVATPSAAQEELEAAEATAPAETSIPAEPTAPSEPTAAGLQLSLFADAYVAYQSAKPGTIATASAHRAYAGQGPTFLSENGFSLSFVGLDASYDNGSVGVTTSLRFGPSVPIFYGGDNGLLGIDNLLQGYVTWHATEQLSLDIGQFGTIFGAEVAESWHNLNYSRGALYYYGQPFWHTGLRASYAINDMIGVTAMVVNGTNNISETVSAADDQTPTFAAQVSVAPSDSFSVVAGGMVALDREENDDAGFDTFFDVVASASFGDLSLVLNADYVITAADDSALDDRALLGLSGAVGYALSPSFGVAGRVEYLTDDAGDDSDPWTLTTGTLTLDWKPNPNFIVRLDGRMESSNQEVFGVAVPDPDNPGAVDDDASDTWFMGVLGFVVTTDP